MQNSHMFIEETSMFSNFTLSNTDSIFYSGDTILALAPHVLISQYAVAYQPYISNRDPIFTYKIPEPN